MSPHCTKPALEIMWRVPELCWKQELIPSCAELLLEYGAKAQLESCLPSPTHEAASKVNMVTFGII
ncbi:hypothetical protein P7K49_005647 [Saguinus oedipus]|uniref:Uncharacterized protein n=1 Tax=Saguinus oedipus TaxID=9490 RepID=A0ABQ9W056_SAGOE|nr:hypothetical protein P7K49_005647 [Saguinus oedipus]